MRLAYFPPDFLPCPERQRLLYSSVAAQNTTFAAELLFQRATFQ